MILSIFLRYLLMPLLALILASLLIFVKQKNALLANKKLIVFILVSALVLCLPGLFGFAGSAFSPWLYLTSQLLYLGAGVAFVQLYVHFFDKEVKRFKILFQSLLLLVIMTLGGYLFAVLFNLCSPTDGGYVAFTAMFTLPVPLLFYHTYLAFISIPFEIYKVWQYPIGSEEISFEGLDFNKLMVLELEFSRHPEDRDRLRVKAKAPAQMPFGEWFKKFIDDYNYKFPNQTISYTDDSGDPNAWVFYCKKSFFHRRRLLDPELSVEENRISEHVSIISKRVFEHTEEQFVNSPKAIFAQI